MADKSQKPTAIRPLVGQFATLAAVATRTGQYDIVRPVRATTHQRNDVIDGQFAFFATVIALAALSFALTFYVIGGVRTLVAHFAGAAAMINGFLSFWIGFSPIVITFENFGAMLLVILALLCLLFVAVLSIVFPVTLDTLVVKFCTARFASRLDKLWVLFAPRSNSISDAAFTLTTVAVLMRSVARELSERFFNIALGTDFRSHLEITFATPCYRSCGQACKGLAVRAVHEATLAHMEIIS